MSRARGRRALRRLLRGRKEPPARRSARGHRPGDRDDREHEQRAGGSRRPWNTAGASRQAGAGDDEKDEKHRPAGAVRSSGPPPGTQLQPDEREDREQRCTRRGRARTGATEGQRAGGKQYSARAELPERIVPDETSRGSSRSTSSATPSRAVCAARTSSIWLRGRQRHGDLAPGAARRRRRRERGYDRLRARRYAGAERRVCGETRPRSQFDGSFDAVCSFETIEHLPRSRACTRGVRPRALRAATSSSCRRRTRAHTTTSARIRSTTVEFDARGLRGTSRRHFERSSLRRSAACRHARHRGVQPLDVLGLRRAPVVPASRVGARRDGADGRGDARRHRHRRGAISITRASSSPSAR